MAFDQLFQLLGSEWTCVRETRISPFTARANRGMRQCRQLHCRNLDNSIVTGSVDRHQQWVSYCQFVTRYALPPALLSGQMAMPMTSRIPLLIALARLLYERDLLATGDAPGGPEVHQQNLALPLAQITGWRHFPGPSRGWSMSGISAISPFSLVGIGGWEPEAIEISHTLPQGRRRRAITNIGLNAHGRYLCKYRGSKLESSDVRQELYRGT